MNHRQGFKVTITVTERLTITRSVKQEIKVEPIADQQKNTATGATVTVFVLVGKDAGNHKA